MTPKPSVDEFCPVVEMTKEELERELAQYDDDRQLSGEELGKLAQQAIDTDDPAEKGALWEAFRRGFYGGVIDA